MDHHKFREDVNCAKKRVASMTEIFQSQLADVHREYQMEIARIKTEMEFMRAKHASETNRLTMKVAGLYMQLKNLDKDTDQKAPVSYESSKRGVARANQKPSCRCINS